MPDFSSINAGYMYLTAGNIDLAHSFMCNLNVSYIKNSLLSLYLAGYQTKVSKENSNAIKKALGNALRHFHRSRQNEDAGGEPRAAFSEGLGRVCSALRGHTGDEAVGAQMAAFLLQGRNVFEYSHDFAYLPLAQGLAFLYGHGISTSFSVSTRSGERSFRVPGVFDYVYRPVELSGLSWWDFLEWYELVSVKFNDEEVEQGEEKKDSDGIDDEYDIDDGDGSDSSEHAADEEAIHNETSDGVFRLMKEHPKYQTSGVRKRSKRLVVRLSGDRLPNTRDLTDNKTVRRKKRVKRARTTKRTKF